MGHCYVKLLVIHTVDVIYCTGSLPNGTAAEERRGKIRTEGDKWEHSEEGKSKGEMKGIYLHEREMSEGKKMNVPIHFISH